jgi:hypothetical protein
MDIRKFRRELFGDIFISKIDRLEIAFVAASAPFRAEIKLVEKEVLAVQKKVDAGEATWRQPTDDGDYDSYGEDLGERRDDALEALRILRAAFMFLIYHQWERLAQHWTKPGESPNHQDLVKAIRADGVPLDEPGLEILRLLVNTLKHNSSKYGPGLYNSRADMFKAGFDPNAINPINGKPYSSIAWADQIELTDEHIYEFIGIIRKSSPR